MAGGETTISIVHQSSIKEVYDLLRYANPALRSAPERRVVVVETAVGDVAGGETTISWSTRSRGEGTLQTVCEAQNPTYRSCVAATQAGSQAVRMSTLDDEWAKVGAPEGSEAVLKVDVEGFELQALRGGGALLRGGRVRHVLVEVHEAAFGVAPLDVVALLRELGFELSSENFNAPINERRVHHRCH